MQLSQRLEKLKSGNTGSDESAQQSQAGGSVEDKPLDFTPTASLFERRRRGEQTDSGGVPQGEAIAETDRFYLFKHTLLDRILNLTDVKGGLDDNERTIRIRIEALINDINDTEGLGIARDERAALAQEFMNEIMGFGPLEPFLNDSDVTKITVNAFDEIYVERLGVLEKTEWRFRDNDHLMAIIQKMAAAIGGRIDSKVPLLDRRLPDDSRIRAKVPPIAASGPTVTIDKSTGNPFEILKRQQQRRQRSRVAPYLVIRERIRERLAREIDPETLAGTQREGLRTQIEEMINVSIAEENLVLSRAGRSELVSDLLNDIVGLGPIEPLIGDPEVSEIMVNGPFQVYVERHGKLELTDKRFRNNSHVMQTIERIVAPLGRRIDEKSPMVDARLPDGSRVNAIIPPLAIKGPTVTIRKFSKDPFTMTDLVNFGTLTNECAQFLKAAVEARLNIVVSGGTGSGKTTMLNVLSSFIPEDERIITIEDAAELQLRQTHVVTLEARPANIEGVGEVTIRDLVKNSLRMRPDRIVVGECRGGEALDMLQAMNTGHDGSLTTAHANSPRDMLGRLEVMVLMAGMDLPVRAIREQIAGAINLVVHCERFKDGSRKISQVTEIVGMEGDVITMQDLFVFQQTGIDDLGKITGAVRATGLRPKCLDKIHEHGIKLSPTIFKF